VLAAITHEAKRLQRPVRAPAVAGVAVVGELAQLLAQCAANTVARVTNELDQGERIHTNDRPGRGPALTDLTNAPQIDRDRIDDDPVGRTVQPAQRRAHFDVPDRVAVSWATTGAGDDSHGGLRSCICTADTINAATREPRQRSRRRPPFDIGDVHVVESRKALERGDAAHGWMMSGFVGSHHGPWSSPVRLARTVRSARAPRHHGALAKRPPTLESEAPEMGGRIGPTRAVRRVQVARAVRQAVVVGLATRRAGDAW
jgi:hypothetical protein